MSKAMRVIEGNLQPGEAFWNIRNAAESESGETEVEFFGPISEYSWWGDEVTPKTFKDALWAAGNGGPVRVKVNSPGGEVFAASAIRSILQDYPGRVTADIIGLAASAATVVVTGADRVVMRDTAMFMVHDPGTVAWGTIEEFEQVLAVLKSVKESILNAYAGKTGKEREELAKLMRDETWMTAQQALEMGFVDEVISSGPVKSAQPSNKLRAGFLNCLSGYANVPDGVTALLDEEAEAAPVDETNVAEEAADSSEAAEADAETAAEQPEGEAGDSMESGDAAPVDEAERLMIYLSIFGPRS